MADPKLDALVHRHLDSGTTVAGKRVIIVYITRDEAASLIPRDQAPHQPLVEVHGAELTPGTFVFLTAVTCSRMAAHRNLILLQPAG